MANEKVSQLVELAAIEIAPNDLFFIADVSTHESKKLTATSLLTFINASASLVAISALTAETASWVAGSDVYGTVESSSWAGTVESASFATRAITADTAAFATTTLAVSQASASWASASISSSWAPPPTNSDTASFLQYVGVSNGTASFALTTGNVVSSSFANTSSVAYSSSYATQSFLSDTASFVLSSSFADSSSWSQTASFMTSEAAYHCSPIKAFAQITWSGIIGKTNPQIRISHNISSFTHVATGVTGSFTVDSYGVLFTTPMPSDQYVYSGQAKSIIYNTFATKSVETDMLINNPDNIIDVNGFTCSIWMYTTQVADFYKTASLVFQILAPL